MALNDTAANAALEIMDPEGARKYCLKNCRYLAPHSKVILRRGGESGDETTTAVRLNMNVDRK
jgi:hypothetical protein